MRTADTFFARLFGVLMLAIVLAHILAFAWFNYYGHRPPPPPPPPAYSEHGEPGSRPPPPPPWRGFGGPLVPLTFQLLTLIAAAWYGARLLSRPIQRLSEAAERLSEDLDTPPLPETGTKEARQAAHAFNLMQRRIREQVQQRGRMLAAVSHDLRTPLARLKLRVEQIPNPQLRSRMGQDLGEMISMLDATLRYLHEQRSSEALQWFDLQALVESMVEDAQDRGADVRFSGHCAPLRVQPLSLRSCISNLLENALRYAGHARIELHDSPQQIEVRVCDNGPGIAPEQREAVFEAFFRVEGSRNRSSGGVGLGLTIAREAARRQGGDILLEETPGGGLTAILRLPR
ncbi:two-component sensor histidine kinase [Pseudomonas alcaligenes]|uniref:histidine kinase n=1 Tax=Aquipseudomonas alcaligenes TaxID=43263 RepID=A0ABR7RZ41_AQUAC|nr:ATP-binding protein [Pseudomonas alcaligenes]MBC9250581.1 two-component sensor histidine kinase [Pseudomonas alcaligenes]